MIQLVFYGLGPIPTDMSLLCIPTKPTKAGKPQLVLKTINGYSAFIDNRDDLQRLKKWLEQMGI